MTRSSPLKLAYYSSPIGRLVLAEQCQCLAGAWFEENLKEVYQSLIALSPVIENDAHQSESALFQQAAVQFDRYFNGQSKAFSIPLTFAFGTEFQHKVWRCLQAIPYGETWSYQQIATELGDKKAVRAVGAANGMNPLSIVVPCHRVIAKSGQLSGYAGGIERKRFLLELESGTV